VVVLASPQLRVSALFPYPPVRLTIMRTGIAYQALTPAQHQNHNKGRAMDTIVNPDPANGTTVPNVGIAAARPKPRGKRATLAAAVVSAGLTLFGLGLATGTAHADEPGQEQQAPGDPAAPAPLPTGPDECIPWAPDVPCVPCKYHWDRCRPWAETHGRPQYPATRPGHH
jgi:hypothetical protein